MLQATKNSPRPTCAMCTDVSAIYRTSATVRYQHGLCCIRDVPSYSSFRRPGWPKAGRNRQFWLKADRSRSEWAVGRMHSVIHSFIPTPHEARPKASVESHTASWVRVPYARTTFGVKMTHPTAARFVQGTTEVGPKKWPRPDQSWSTLVKTTPKSRRIGPDFVDCGRLRAKPGPIWST